MDGSTGPAATRRRALDSALSDEEVVERVRAGEIGLYELLMRRHNQRLFRAVRAILRDEAEVEDVLQEAYLAAFRRLDAFEGRARFSTWLVRIAVNRALDRRRRRARMTVVDWEERGEHTSVTHDDSEAWSPVPDDPERASARRELVHRLEDAIDDLPQHFRGVFLLRDVEGMSTEEAADSLGIAAATVKTRLHRARGLPRRRLAGDHDGLAGDAFPFGAERCDRLVAAVLARLRSPDA